VVGSGTNLIFTHTVKEGGSDKSFGIHVAKMAGLPSDVIERANELMDMLEGKESEMKTKVDLKQVKSQRDRNKPSDGQLAIFEIRDDHVREKLRNINPDALTPIEALQLIGELHNDAMK
jgi:DNA mismatch repair protein MutS